MSRLLAATVLALSLTAGTAAQAQSYTAPAGIPAATTASGGATVYESGRGWAGGGAATTYDRLTTGSVARTGRVPAAHH